MEKFLVYPLASTHGNSMSDASSKEVNYSDFIACLDKGNCKSTKKRCSSSDKTVNALSSSCAKTERVRQKSSRKCLIDTKKSENGLFNDISKGKGKDKLQIQGNLKDDEHENSLKATSDEKISANDISLTKLDVMCEESSEHELDNTEPSGKVKAVKQESFLAKFKNVKIEKKGLQPNKVIKLGDCDKDNLEKTDSSVKSNSDGKLAQSKKLSDFFPMKSKLPEKQSKSSKIEVSIEIHTKTLHNNRSVVQKHVPKFYSCSNVVLLEDDVVIETIHEDKIYPSIDNGSEKGNGITDHKHEDEINSIDNGAEKGNGIADRKHEDSEKEQCENVNDSFDEDGETCLQDQGSPSALSTIQKDSESEIEILENIANGKTCEMHPKASNSDADISDTEEPKKCKQVADETSKYVGDALKDMMKHAKKDSKKKAPFIEKRGDDRMNGKGPCLENDNEQGKTEIFKNCNINVAELPTEKSEKCERRRSSRLRKSIVMYELPKDSPKKSQSSGQRKEKGGKAEKEKSGKAEKEKSGKAEKEKTGKAEKEKTGKAEKEKSGKAEKEKTGKAEKEKTGKAEKEKTGKAEKDRKVVGKRLLEDSDDSDEPILLAPIFGCKAKGGNSELRKDHKAMMNPARRSFLMSSFPEKLNKSLDPPPISLEAPWPTVSEHGGHEILHDTKPQPAEDTKIKFKAFPRPFAVPAPQISTCDFPLINRSGVKSTTELKELVPGDFSGEMRQLLAAEMESVHASSWGIYSMLTQKTQALARQTSMHSSVMDEKRSKRPVAEPAKPSKRRRLLDGAAKASGKDGKSTADPGSSASACATLWTEKYKPTAAREVLGNVSSVAGLRSWLCDWVQRGRLEQRRLARQVAGEARRSGKSRESVQSQWGLKWVDIDDVGSDFEDSSGDGSDSEDDVYESICKAVVLCGPHGVGKTAAVYALASQLDLKVIEVNASDRRCGKQMFADLLEATQSHQVAKDSLRPDFTAADAFSSVEQRDEKKPRSGNIFQRSSRKKCPAKASAASGEGKPQEDSKKISKSSQGLNLSKNLVILFEECDVELEDRGFLSTVQSFVMSAKRPIILTSSSHSFPSMLSCQHQVLHFKPCQTSSLVQYLQCICLCENVRADHRDLLRLVEECGADLRRCLCQLQLLFHSLVLPSPHPLQILPGKFRGKSAESVASKPDSADDFESPKMKGNRRRRRISGDEDDASHLTDWPETFRHAAKRPPDVWLFVTDGQIEEDCLKLYRNLHLKLALPLRNSPPLPFCVPESANVRREAASDLFDSEVSDTDNSLPAVKPSSDDLLASSDEVIGASEEAVSRQALQNYGAALPCRGSSPVEAYGLVQSSTSPSDECDMISTQQSSQIGALRSLALLFDSFSVTDCGRSAPRRWPSWFPSVELPGDTQESRACDFDALKSDDSWRVGHLEQAFRMTKDCLQEQVESIPAFSALLCPDLQSKECQKLRSLMHGTSCIELATLNQPDVACDVQPTLRQICRDEKLRRSLHLRRRFLHYFDSVQLPLNSSTRAHLANQFSNSVFE